MRAFGEEFKLQRVRAGVKQRQLADELDVKSAYLSRIEGGVAPCSEEQALRCIDALSKISGGVINKQALISAAYGSIAQISLKGIPAEDRSRIGLEVVALRKAID